MKTKQTEMFVVELDVQDRRKEDRWTVRNSCYVHISTQLTRC